VELGKHDKKDVLNKEINGENSLELMKLKVAELEVDWREQDLEIWIAIDWGNMKVGESWQFVNLDSWGSWEIWKLGNLVSWGILSVGESCQLGNLGSWRILAVGESCQLGNLDSLRTFTLCKAQLLLLANAIHYSSFWDFQLFHMQLIYSTLTSVRTKLVLEST
jgi:hypothetical protein